MSPGKEKKRDHPPVFPRTGHSLRDSAEEQLERSNKNPPDFAGKTQEEVIHELQVHQVELEMQAEELRRSYLALEESRDKFLDLYDFSPLCYLTLNDKALVEEVNLTGALLLGIVRRKLLHTRFRKFIVQKDLEKWDRYFMSVLKTGEKVCFDLEILHSNGSVFPARLDCIRIPGNESGPAVRIVISDITRQKEAEAAIRESEERFWRLFSEIPLPYQSLDEEGRLLEVSPRWLETLGYSRAEVTGRMFWDFLAPEEQARAREIFQTFRKSGAVNNVELRMQKKDKSELLVLYTGRVVSNPNGSFRQTYDTLVDITERKRVENALNLSNKKLNLLSSITRHDINNQILVVNGFLALLHNEIQNPSSEKLFARISDASNRIATLIQFTREYEKIGVNAPVWVDCRTLVQAAAQQAPLGNVVVKNDLPCDAEVFADPLVQKVFYNLMDNAVRYGEKITFIRFFVEKAGTDHVIVCEDDGRGIVAADKVKIFERGFGKNTGLGLALSREILDITGITIRETGEPEHGARFEIMVPKEAWRRAPRT